MGGALSVAPAGLLTDLDGTLAPVVATPHQARPVEGAVDALEELASRLAVVAIITGRSAADARRILGNPSSLLIVGNHGLELLEPGASAAETDPSLAVVRDVIQEALLAVPMINGVTVEDKGLSATVHYRGSADPRAARAGILAALVAARGDLDLREGRMSVEVRPAGMGDKGTAVRGIVQRFGLRGLVVAGDDRTDLDMFVAATELEQSRRLRVTRLAVAGGREVPREVAAAAEVVLGSPGEFARLLRRLASRMASGRPLRSDAEPGP